MSAPAPIHTNREDARSLLLAKIDSQTRLLNAIDAEKNLPASCRKTFTTHPPAWIISDARWRLRWIDCAPEGANHICAPLQDKAGVPLGQAWSENVGDPREVRERREATGRCPLTGQWPGPVAVDVFGVRADGSETDALLYTVEGETSVIWGEIDWSAEAANLGYARVSLRNVRAVSV